MTVCNSRTIRVLSGGLLVGAALLASGPDSSAGSVATVAELVAKPRAVQDDLLAVVLRFVEGSRFRSRPGAAAPEFSWDSAVGVLKAKGILDAGFRQAAGRRVERGDAALLFARALGLRGGAGGRLWGLGRRAAYRELVDLRLLPGGGESYQMSGAELVSLLDRARQYQQQRRSGE